MVVDDLHLMGQFTVLGSQALSGQANMALVETDGTYGNVLGLMVVEGTPFDLTFRSLRLPTKRRQLRCRCDLRRWHV